MEPHDYDDIDIAYAREPETTIPKTIGILNIAFGTLLLFCVYCSSANLTMQSAMGPMMAEDMKQFEEVIREARQQQIHELEAREQAALDDLEKAQLQARINALKAQPAPKMPDFAKVLQGDLIQGYAIADTLTGLLFNVLMVISGLGLVGQRKWARGLALWVAFLKILRLVGLNVFFIVAVAPVINAQLTDVIREFGEEMAKADPPGGKAPGPAEFQQIAHVIDVLLTSLGVATIVIGVIYPVIVLVLLTRPHVKSACARNSR